MRVNARHKTGVLRLLSGMVVLGCLYVSAQAQISLNAAVDLALRNDPKVRMAQADVDKAKAAYSESKDVFIPSVQTSGGIGKSDGVPLGLPVVFTISAQSLAFNFSQHDYIRSARAGMEAARLSLTQMQGEVVEDTVTTYLGLDNALQRRAAMQEASAVSARLVKIVQDRYDAGAEAHIEVSKAKKSVAELNLQALLVNDEIDRLASHLASVTGLSGRNLTTVHSSIPAIDPPGNGADNAPDSPGLEAAYTQVLAKEFSAHGDSRYRLRPQVAFSAAYSRVSTVGTNYGQYYPKFNTDNPANAGNSLNALQIGVQISVPILDYMHEAKARGARAEAAHARFEAQEQEMQFREGREKLRHSAAELAARSDIASLDRDLAQDQLDAVRLQLKADAATQQGTQLSPKDEENAHLQERERYLDMLNADLQLRQTEIMLMQQTGTLGEWLHRVLAVPPAELGPVTP